MAQIHALEAPDRVLSLVLISTTAATAVGRALPPPTAEFGRFVTTAQVDWSDSESITEYLVSYSRVLAGSSRPFDEPSYRDLVRREIERARDPAALQNHDLLSEGEPPPASVSAISAPTLVIHGTADPMFPLEHGEALAAEIPGARLVALQGAGHGVYREDWDSIVREILEHTATTPGAGS
jgi:pimeloyl-ACP methyl ester carboxylesterase